MKIILTAFEPFGKNSINASLEAVNLVTAPKDVQLIKLTLPVIYGKDFQPLLKTIEKEKPDAVLCIGEAGGESSVRIERVAINLNDGTLKDNDGVLLQDEKILPEGPSAYFSLLPDRDIYQAISLENIPVRLSYSAGTYICNDTMYRLLDYCNKQNLNIMAGFIHIMYTPSQAQQFSIEHYMDSQQTAKAIEIALEVIANKIKSL